MDKYIYDDKNGLWYELQGDYYIPCLGLLTEKEKPIGLWGQRHLHYLKEHKRSCLFSKVTPAALIIIESLTCFHAFRKAPDQV